ncbi:BtpA/SgcQ family protein [Patescibacteria group bacterium]|nr:MAG: BtpA/SgcQ family protein [Patescibacteria group bacterium]
MTLSGIFKKSKNIVIGAVHFPPLLGYKEFPGFDVALKNAIADLRAFESGGVDGVIFENNYDIPHKTAVDAPIISSMTFLGQELRKTTRLPLGISVLWNDYKAALSIAKILNLQFIRVPVFVDKVRTDYGIVNGVPKKVIDFRKSIGAEKVALFTDIHVKHATLLSRYDLITSAKMAIKNKSDALIITGKWTGNAPAATGVKNLRSKIEQFPILIGSGVNENNAKKLFKFANGAIVSTSLKKGLGKSKEVNVKSYNQRMEKSKVKDLIKSLK